MVTFFHDVFLGSRNFLAIIEPNRIVMHPAIIKRAPANMMREAVSSGPIRKSSYAIFIAGEALPHRTQQKIAMSRVTGNHDQMTRVCCCASLTAMKKPPCAYESAYILHNSTFFCILQDLSLYFFESIAVMGTFAEGRVQYSRLARETWRGIRVSAI